MIYFVHLIYTDSKLIAAIVLDLFAKNLLLLFVCIMYTEYYREGLKHDF